MRTLKRDRNEIGRGNKVADGRQCERRYLTEIMIGVLATLTEVLRSFFFFSKNIPPRPSSLTSLAKPPSPIHEYSLCTWRQYFLSVPSNRPHLKSFTVVFSRPNMSVLRQTHPVHFLPPYFFTIHLILSSHLRLCLASGFPPSGSCVCVSFLPYMAHTLPCNSPWRGRPGKEYEL